MEESDIYFIMGLSQRGERVQLFRSHPGDESISTLIMRHFPGDKMMRGGKVKIETIDNLPLRMILYTIARVSATQALHESLKSQFQYVLECLTPTIFNWCGGLLANMKR